MLTLYFAMLIKQCTEQKNPGRTSAISKRGISMKNHPVVELFEVQAKLMDFSANPARLDDAIKMLAAWIAVATDRLTEGDLAALICVGGILYREGLHQQLLEQRSEPPPNY